MNIPLDSLNDYECAFDSITLDDESSDLFYTSSESKYIDQSDLSDFFKPPSISNTYSFKLIHINCRSLKAHFDELEHLILDSEVKYSIIALTETWLTEDNKNIFHLPGYSFISKCRDGKRAGGVGIYVHDDFNFVLRDNLSISNSCVESLFVDLTLKQECYFRSFTVGCMYRPPNGNMQQFKDHLTYVLPFLDFKKNKISCITGDLNIDLLNNNANAISNECMNLLLSHSFVPLINKPTRVTNSSATLIDNIFVNNLHCTFKSGIVYNDISDHFPIITQFDFSYSRKNNTKEQKNRCFSSSNIAKFFTYLESTDWDSLLLEQNEPCDVNILYSKFFEIYSRLFSHAFPISNQKPNRKKNPRTEWITPGLIRSCMVKSKLYKKYKQNPTIITESIYKTYRNKLKQLLRNAEHKYYTDKIYRCQGNVKQLWKILKDLLQNCKSSAWPSSFIYNGLTLSDRKEIVEKFNDFFSSIGPNLAAKIPSSSTDILTYLKGSFSQSFVLLPTDASEIISITNSLKNKKSFGQDEIPVDIMKKSIQYISEPLAIIFNSSFKTGTFPDLLKIAKVCPVFKDGSKQDISNYRPISILPSFSKILEKLVYVRLYNYVVKCNILTAKQFGFQPSHSCYMALLELYDRLSEAIDNKEFAIGLFIDLQKAFDTLDHGILLRKLSFYGIRGTPLLWFCSYLKNRKQYVCIDNVSSSLKVISCGVPQGSILGPLLFLLFINDLVNCSNVLNFLLFADDTNMMYSNKSLKTLVSTMNIELCNLSNWFLSNKLSLNLKKTHYILFGGRHVKEEVNIFINKIKIEQVTVTKFLGVYVDQKLNWKNHIDHISKKISSNLGVINKIKYKLNSKSLVELYNAMILPHLTYCLIVWGGASNSILNSVTILQKKALRLITKSTYNAHTDPLFFNLQKLKLADLFKMQIATFVFNSHTHNFPPKLDHFYNYFQFKSIFKPYHIRNIAGAVDCEPFRTEVRKRCIRCLGPSVFNPLPSSIKRLNSEYLFKKQLKSLFLNQYSH